MPKLRPGVVSVILVNFRGVEDTLQAVSELEALTWDHDLLEVIVVENASGDDSLSRLQSLGDRITLVIAKSNLGFAGGCNLGVSRSQGEFVAFLNNDAKPDPGWIRAAISKFGESPDIAAVASKVLDWEGERVDFVGAALTWYGMGYKPFTAEVFHEAIPIPGDVLFGTGSAMFVRRSVFDELGGFDERYFMFFEDVDFGWRLNLLGYRFAYSAESVAFHKHHGSMGAFGEFRERYLLERNALFTLYKNLSDSTLAEALPAAMALAVRRTLAMGEVDSTALDIRNATDESESMTVPKAALTASFAIDQFVESLPSLRMSRDRIQATRKVSDDRMWKLFGSTDIPAFSNDRYLEGYENVVTSFDVVDAPDKATKVLIITGDPIGRKLAGPAIRAWNMALALARDNEVTLMTLSGAEPVPAPFKVTHVRPGDDRAFKPLEEAADVIVFQGHAMAVFEALRRTEKVVVVDIYDPMHLEQLEQGRELGAEVWARQVSDATDVLNEQLSRGDFFMCASDRQRHFYLGQLAGLGRLNPSTYSGDPDLKQLIDVVPFGLDPTGPVHIRDVLKGVRTGIGADDKLLLWSGGLYNWFDPKALITAVARLSQSRPNVKLFFQGTKHPHPGVPEMEIVSQARELARELGVLDSAVFLNDSWVDFADRQNYLTEADAGVSTHFAHVETTFSFRTRILDYLWAGLPMVVTEGDHFAELIESEGLGVVVPAQDIDALVAALEKVLFDEEFGATCRENIARVRASYEWDVVLDPLVRFVADARVAADRTVSSRQSTARPRRRVKRSGVRHDLELAMFYLRNGGPRTVLRKIRSRLVRRT